MLKNLFVVLLVAVLVSLFMLGCGSGSNGNLPSGGGDDSTREKGGTIPAPGTVLTQHPVDWLSLFAGPSRGLDTRLGQGWFSNLLGVPTPGTVPETRLAVFSSLVSPANPNVWTLTTTSGDADLAVYTRGIVIGWSANSGTTEEWVAHDPGGTGSLFGLVHGFGPGTNSFQVESDNSQLLVVNGASRTGRENDTRRGSDWFHLDLPWSGPDPLTYTVHLTALAGDPDLFIYDTDYGNGSAPAYWSRQGGSDEISFETYGNRRFYVRVQAWIGSPCKYKIWVTQP